jgi:hypothetical protein
MPYPSRLDRGLDLYVEPARPFARGGNRLRRKYLPVDGCGDILARNLPTIALCLLAIDEDLDREARGQ